MGDDGREPGFESLIVAGGGEAVSAGRGRVGVGGIVDATAGEGTEVGHGRDGGGVRGWDQ